MKLLQYSLIGITAVIITLVASSESPRSVICLRLNYLSSPRNMHLCLMLVPFL
jgi:hypothetical protein